VVEVSRRRSRRRRSGNGGRTVVTAVLLVEYCPTQRVKGEDGQA
jgi:hypothetical protein